jgi:hypothetical protein
MYRKRMLLHLVSVFFSFFIILAPRASSSLYSCPPRPWKGVRGGCCDIEGEEMKENYASFSYQF